MTDFKATMHQIRFRFPQTPLGELTALPRPPIWIWGHFAAVGEGLGWGRGGKREGKGREREVEGREGEGPQVTVEPRPLRDLLRHWTFAMTAVRYGGPKPVATLHHHHQPFCLKIVITSNNIVHRRHLIHY